MTNRVYIIVVDPGMLNLSTYIWKEQLDFLDKFSGRAKFAWMLNHDDSNAIKTEHRRKGHILMVNKQLYKTKMIHILEAVVRERDVEHHKRSPSGTEGTVRESGSHECLEINSTHFETCSSNDSDISETSREETIKSNTLNCQTPKKCLVELMGLGEVDNLREDEDEFNVRSNLHDTEDAKCENSNSTERDYVRSSTREGDNSYTNKAANQDKYLEGQWILLADDTPVLQRVATIMLEKMGTMVVAVGDGLQAVDALNCELAGEEYRRDGLQTDI